MDERRRTECPPEHSNLENINSDSDFDSRTPGRQVSAADHQTATIDDNEVMVPPEFFVDTPIKFEHSADSVESNNDVQIIGDDDEGAECEIPPGFFDELLDDLPNIIKQDLTADTPGPAVKDEQDCQGIDSKDDSTDDDKPQCSKHIKSRRQRTSELRRKHQRSVSNSPHRHRETHSKSSTDRRRLRSPSRKSSKRSRRSRSLSPDIELLRVRPDELPKLKPIQSDILSTAPKNSSSVEPAESEALKVKQQRGIACAKEQLKAFRMSCKSDGTFSEFIYTPTTYSIPKKASLMSKTTSENRSPLSTNHNVIYEQTSLGSRVDLAQYGLQRPSQPVVDLLKMVRLDVSNLEARRAKSKMPPKLLKQRVEQCDEGAGRQSIIHRDAQTQTDAKPRRPVSHSVGTQYTSSRLVDISLMNDQQRFAFFLFRQLIETVPRSYSEEMQQNSRLIHAVNLARRWNRRRF